MSGCCPFESRITPLSVELPMQGRFAFWKEGHEFVLISANCEQHRISRMHRKYKWLSRVESGRVINVNRRWTSAKDYGDLYGFLEQHVPSSIAAQKQNSEKRRKLPQRLTKREVLFRQFRKFTRKSQEAYVISRIWHRLGLDDVEMLTQQYVHRESGGYALTDAYFPQVGIHIEVMEDAHREKVELDAIRKEEIVEVTGHNVLEVWPGRDAEGGGSLNALHNRIEDIVFLIRSKREIKIQSGDWEPWDPEFKYSVDKWRAAGEVSLKNQAAFRLIADACNAFGHRYEGYQKAWATNPMDSSTGLWFPKLYPNKAWHNELSADGRTIVEKCLSLDPELRRDHFLQCSQRTMNRVTFARVISPMGMTLYRFVGVFEMDHLNSSPNGTVCYRRIAVSAKTKPLSQKQ